MRALRFGEAKPRANAMEVMSVGRLRCALTCFNYLQPL